MVEVLEGCEYRIYRIKKNQKLNVMINFDDAEKTWKDITIYFKLATNSRISIENNNSQRPWNRKNKCIT